MNIQKGFRTDERPYNQIDGSWRYAKNVIINGNSINNEEGFDLIEALTKPVIGSVQDGVTTIIFSTDNTFSEIGILDINNVYTTIVNSAYIGFNLENPIEGRSKRNFKDETIVTWISGLNTSAKPPSILNLQNLPFALNSNMELVNPSEVVKIYLKPEIKVPEIDSIIEYTGNIPTGSIQFAIAYLINDIDVTEFVYISDSFHNKEDKGRGVKIQLKNLDNRYDKYRIVVINRKNTTTEIFHIGDIDTNINSFVYVGQNFVHSYTLNDIIIPTASFDRVQAITTVKDQLIYGNFKTTEIDYQCYANNINVKWDVISSTSYLIDRCIDLSESGFTDFNENSVTYDFFGRTFKPNEVYALYIALVNKDGSESKGYHIPGRDILPYTVNIIKAHSFPSTFLSTYEAVTNDNGVVTISVTSSSADPVSTTLLSNTREYIINLNGNHYEMECARFELTGGSSPIRNTYITLKGTYVVFPEPNNGLIDILYDASLKENRIITHGAIDSRFLSNYHLADTSNGTTGILGYWENKNEVYPNTDDFNICDLTGVIGNIKGKNVRHHRMPTYATIKTKADTDSIGDFLFTLRLENVIIPDEIKDKVQGYRLYFAQKDNNNQTVVSEGNGIRQTDNIIDGGTTIPNSTDRFRYYSKETLDYKPSLNNNNMYIRYSKERNNTTFNGTVLNAISSISYVPQGNSTANPNREEHIAIRTITNIPSNSIFSIEQVLSDVHLKYENQTTVDTGLMFLTNDTDNVYNSGDILGGDTYERTETVAVHSYNEPDVITNRVKKIYTFLSHSSYSTDLPHFVNEDRVVNIMFITLNNIKPLSINDGLTRTTNTFAYRIARSLKDFDETLTIGWRKFLINSYYDMPRTKGEVWKLENVNRVLYIQHKYTVYVASIKDVLQTSNITAFLGDGDLFDRQPDEIITTENGYIGCQSKFAAFTTKVGYCVVDQNQGKIFLISGTTPKEISSNGLRNFFRDNLGLATEIDNPFNGIGILGVYDEKWNRILITKNIKRTTETETDYSFTFSYSPVNDSWIALHDYIPDAIFNTRNKVFSVNNTSTGNVYLHNIESKRGRFYDQSVDSESIIDIVFNSNRIESKLITSINWVSDSIESNNNTELKDTITHIMIYNNYQCSGIIPLQLVPTWFNEIKDIKEEEWSFNKFSDVVVNRNLPFIDSKFDVISSNVSNNKSWFRKNKFIGKFVIVRFIYDNSSQNDFFLNDVKVNGRISDR